MTKPPQGTKGVIKLACHAEDFAAARTLFREYETAFDFCPCFEAFDRELAQLETLYQQPQGVLWLAQFEGEAAAVVGLRLINGDPKGTWEVKRLWVRPPYRGCGLASALMRALLSWAADHGCSRLVLETVPGAMDPAISLYRRFGFCDCASERAAEGVIAMELKMSVA